MIHQADSDSGVTMVTTPTWPKVVGIVSIVFGSLGLLGSGCGLVGLGFAVASRPMLEEAAEGYPLPPNMDVGVLMPVLVMIGLGLSGLLLGAGIMTLKRKYVGRMLHLAYVGISIPATGLNVYFQLTQMNAMRQYVADHPGSPFSQNHNETMSWIGFAVGMLLGVGWLAFLVLWFGFVKTKPSDMTGDPADDEIAPIAAV